MKLALAAPLALMVASFAAPDAWSLDAPIKWTINARILGVNGTPPEGFLSGIGFDWNLNFVVTVAGTEPAPDDMIPGGERQQRLILTDGFSIDFDAPGVDDDFLIVGNGADIDGAYIPMNQEISDSADYYLRNIPLTNDRGGVIDTFTLRFGFFGNNDLLGGDDDFISMPDLSMVSGTGFFVEFENGAFAFGELVGWESVIVPAPGSVALFGLASLAAVRRRR